MDAKMLNRARGTEVRECSTGGTVRYHNTIVVDWNVELIRLNTGGWQTVTTKRRMNQASDAFGLGFGVYQKDYDWYAAFKGKIYRFQPEGGAMRLTLRRNS